LPFCQCVHRVLYFVMFLVITWCIAILIVAIVQCQPFSYFWNQYVDPTARGRCINIAAFYVGNGAANVITDFIILIIPIPIIWNLQMPIMERLSVLGIFLLGGLYVFFLFYPVSTNGTAISSVCGAGVVRLFFLTKMFKSADFTWNMSQAFIWSSVEPNIGIFCACLPTIRRLVRRCLPRWFGRSGITSDPQRSERTHCRHHQTGDFHTLHDRNTRNIDNSDDKMGLTNDFHLDHRRPPHDSTEGSIALENHIGIMVKRDIEWTSAPAL
jgi:hypothetical protein